MNLNKAKVSIISTDIADLNYGAEQCTASAISVTVEILFHKMRFTIEYKAIAKQDKNATATYYELSPAKGSLEYPTISSICASHNINFNTLLDKIKSKSHVQKIWNEYVKDHYEVDDKVLYGKRMYDWLKRKQA